MEPLSIILLVIIGLYILNKFTLKISVEAIKNVDDTMVLIIYYYINGIKRTKLINTRIIWK